MKQEIKQALIELGGSGTATCIRKKLGLQVKQSTTMYETLRTMVKRGELKREWKVNKKYRGSIGLQTGYNFVWSLN